MSTKVRSGFAALCFVSTSMDAKGSINDALTTVQNAPLSGQQLTTGQASDFQMHYFLFSHTFSNALRSAWAGQYDFKDSEPGEITHHEVVVLE